jgi:GxxExxY protein
MDANRELRMNVSSGELLLKEEVFEVVGCAMEVLNELGHGLLEKPYENALVVEFGLRGVAFRQQPHFDVLYKGVAVGEYVPDLITHDKLVVDTKVIDRITDHELGQILNYLKVTGLEVGLILNFKRSKLEWKRIVLEKNE